MKLLTFPVVPSFVCLSCIHYQIFMHLCDISCLHSYASCCLSMLWVESKSLHVEYPPKQQNTICWSCSPQRSMPRGRRLFQLWILMSSFLISWSLVWPFHSSSILVWTSCLQMTFRIYQEKKCGSWPFLEEPFGFHNDMSNLVFLSRKTKCVSSKS